MRRGKSTSSGGFKPEGSGVRAVPGDGPARKAAEISLVSQVADQYLTVLELDDLLKVTQNTLKTADESYRITKLQFDNGMGSELDVRQAQTRGRAGAGEPAVGAAFAGAG